MALHLYKSENRGRAEHGWLHARFSFSFAEYYDSTRLGFGVLRVLNNDTIEPLSGFGTHPHENMEIITYVLSGALEHKDSFGNEGIIKAGELQYMSAGEGVRHSERNPLEDQATELFQIWIYPNVKGGAPRYAQMSLENLGVSNGNWCCVVSGESADKRAINIKQDANIYIGRVNKGATIEISSTKESHGRFMMLVHGRGQIGSIELSPRDEVQMSDNETYLYEAQEDSELLLFDVPMRP